MNLRRCLVVLFMGVAPVLPASAAILFTASLTNDQEVAPTVVDPASYGTATLELNDAEDALSFTIDIFNIDVTGTQTLLVDDNLTSAHIHFAPAGVNGGVVFGFYGTPLNNIGPNELVVTPLANGVGGRFTATWNGPEGNGVTSLTAQLGNLFAGNLYLNFHTVRFPGGEVRGQILQVPEPGTLALLGLGLAGLVTLRRRKQ